MNIDWEKMDRYTIRDEETGEEIRLGDVFGDPAKKGYNITYPEQMAKLFVLTGGPTAKLMAYILTHKRKDNLLVGSANAISQRAGVSRNTTARAMKVLQEEDILRRVQNGLYMVNPDVACWGGLMYQAMRKKWGQL